MTLTAFYDLAFGPISYDFVTWLVRAIKVKEERGCDSLHVVIVPKEDGLGGFSRHWGTHDEAAARWRLWHIVVASCPLAKASVTVAPDRDHAERMLDREFWWPEGKAHFMGPLVEASRRGETIPKLQPTEAARRYVKKWLPAGRGLVTLTTRNQDTDPDRNTNTKSWEEFQEWLAGEGFTTMELQDTNVALTDSIGQYAELDPDLRLALYEMAEMNIIGNNGPQELLKFSQAPYIAMGQALSEGWKEHFQKYFSMSVGEQLPWAAKNQKLAYKQDTFDNLVAEWATVMNSF